MLELQGIPLSTIQRLLGHRSIKIGNPPEVDEAAIEQAWIEEVRRRVEARRREPSKLIPWSTVRDELRNR